MADTNSPVTGATNPNVPAGMSGAGSVPAGTTPSGAGDATSAPSVTDLMTRLEKLESDRRAQQAVYDRKLAEAARQQQLLQQQLEEERKSKMTDAERQQFELTSYKQRYEELVAQRQQEQQMQEYARAFAETFKIDPAKIDTTSQEAVVDSGWRAVAEKIAELEGRAKAPVTGQPPQAKPNTTVITGSGGAPRTKLSQLEMMDRVAASMGKQRITVEEFYKWADRNPDAMTEWLRED